jgi:hypothetical protein
MGISIHLRLSCSKCPIEVKVRGYADRPDGWPLHRCKGREILRFDTVVPDRATHSSPQPVTDLTI